MSKLIPSISGFACIAWVAIWSWWFSAKQPTNHSSPETPPTTSFSISDNGFNIAAAEVFTFHISSATPVIPHDNLLLLQSLANYLNEHPDKHLYLTGEYLPTERNKTSYPNLGVARAHSLKDILVKEGVNSNQISIDAIEVQSNFSLEGRLIGGVDFSFGETPGDEDEPASESGDDETAVEENDEKNTSSAIRFFYEDQIFTLARKNRSVLDSIRRVLRKNPSKTIILSGFSLENEEEQVSGNLAERRARAVRRYLVDTGVRRKQILVESYPASATTDETRRTVEMKIITKGSD